MKAVSIAGFKNSGKTTLTRELAQVLERRGLRVAVAKRSHHPLDKPSTDTARLRAPGRTVLAVSEAESAIFWGEERPLHDLLPLLNVDLLLLEGGKQRHWLPRILCLRHRDEAGALNQGLALASWGAAAAPDLPHFQAEDMEALADLVWEKSFALPGLDCGACGHEDCLGLAQAVVRGEESPAACTVMHSEVRVRINGRSLPLNPFTAKILGGAIGGMLRELKGATAGQAVIEINL